MQLTQKPQELEGQCVGRVRDLVEVREILWDLPFILFNF